MNEWLDLNYNTSDNLSWGCVYLGSFLVCILFVLSMYSAYIVYVFRHYICDNFLWCLLSSTCTAYVLLSINCTQVYLRIYVWLATDPVSCEIHCIQACLVMWCRDNTSIVYFFLQLHYKLNYTDFFLNTFWYLEF